jgi:O-antigen/teichoic acid export membrane protein
MNRLIILGVGKLAQVLILLVSIRFLTSHLNHVNLANYYIYTSLYTFPSLVLINPIAQYFNRHSNKYLQNGDLFNKLILYIFYTLLVSTVTYFCMFSLNIFNFFTLSNKLIFICVLSILIITTNQFLLHTINLLFNSTVFVILTFLTSLLSVVFAVFVIVYINHSYIGWAYGLIIGNFLVLLLSVFYLLSKNNKKLRVIDIYATKSKLHDIVKFSFPIALATLFMWYLSSGYKISVEKYFGLYYKYSN